MSTDRGEQAGAAVALTISRAFRKAARRPGLLPAHRDAFARAADAALNAHLDMGGRIAAPFKMAPNTDGRQDRGGDDEM